MTESEGSKLRFETWLVIGFVVAMILSTTVIVVTNSSKSTVFSAYVTDSENENILSNDLKSETNTNNKISDEILKLNGLKTKGLLSEEEFEKAKEKLLS